MSIESTEDRSITDDMRGKLFDFMEEVDTSVGEIPSTGIREASVASAAVQMILQWFQHQAETDHDGDQERQAAHAEQVLRGLGGGVASFFRDSPAGTVTSAMADIAAGAGEIEMHNARKDDSFEGLLRSVFSRMKVEIVPDDDAVQVGAKEKTVIQ